MKALVRSVLVLITVLLAACVQSGPTQEVSVTYDEAVYGKYNKSGKASIVGQAFLRQRGGGVVVCAGAQVILFPNTPDIRKIVELARNRIRPIALGSDPRFKKTSRRTVCDAQGNFQFKDLPSAKWFIYVQVSWTVGDYNHQGGDLVGEIDTENGSENKILLTDRNRI